jgi:hypothetical protein
VADPLDELAADPAVARSLHLVFSDAGAFLREYQQNLVKGGAFVASDESFEAREIVEVRVEVPFAGTKLDLSAEVVHSGPGGVAVQFLVPTPDLRKQFEPAVKRAEALRAEAAADQAATELSSPELGATLDGAHALLGNADLEGLSPDEQRAARAEASAEPDPNERTFRDRADRAPTRVPVRVKGPTGQSLSGRTRDLSKTGVLLSVDGEELPIGREVEIELTHPATNELLAVTGRVKRHLTGEGVVPAVAVEIHAGVQRAALERFVDEVRRLDEEHQRSGIRGPLEELGAVGLLQMFAALARCGTLTVTSGVEEGVASFADGQLLQAQVGSVVGVKALARIFGWRDGFFEFRATVDQVPATGEPTLMEASILEALRLLDEANRQAGPELAPAARFTVHRAELADTQGSLDTTEEAVIDLAAAGFTVRRILDVIPESDVAIRAAIAGLLERGLLSER